MSQPFRIFATCDIGQEALQLLRDRGWRLEVYEETAPPARELLLGKVKSGIDALLTTLWDASRARPGPPSRWCAKRPGPPGILNCPGWATTSRDGPWP